MTKLCPRGKAAAKRKFAVYPSAYANAYASKICAGKIKDPSGTKRKDFKGPKPAGKVAGGMTAGAMSGMGRLQKARMMNKGGGADTGRTGELKSKLGVAINKIKRNRPKALRISKRSLDILKKSKQKFQSEKDLPRSMRIDTTTSAYGDAGKGRPVPKYQNGGPADGLPRTRPGQSPRAVKPDTPRYRAERYKKPTATKKGMRKKLPFIKRDRPAKGFNVGGLADYYKDLM
jgi:hypothetical protein